MGDIPLRVAGADAAHRRGREARARLRHGEALRPRLRDSRRHDRQQALPRLQERRARSRPSDLDTRRHAGDILALRGAEGPSRASGARPFDAQVRGRGKRASFDALLPERTQEERDMGAVRLDGAAPYDSRPRRACGDSRSSRDGARLRAHDGGRALQVLDRSLHRSRGGDGAFAARRVALGSRRARHDELPQLRFAGIPGEILRA